MNPRGSPEGRALPRCSCLQAGLGARPPPPPHAPSLRRGEAGGAGGVQAGARRLPGFRRGEPGGSAFPLAQGKKGRWARAYGCAARSSSRQHLPGAQRLLPAAQPLLSWALSGLSSPFCSPKHCQGTPRASSSPTRVWCWQPREQDAAGHCTPHNLTLFHLLRAELPQILFNPRLEQLSRLTAKPRNASSSVDRAKAFPEPPESSWRLHPRP